MDLSSHGVVAVIINSDGKLLLLKEARDIYNGAWAPPHGRCEIDDKTEENAVMREVKEETGLKVQPIKKLYTQHADSKVATVSFWLVREVGGRLAIDQKESSESGWFSIDEALKLKLYPGTKIFLEKVQRDEISID